MKTLAITIPAKDEQGSIGNVIKGIPKLPQFSKVIVIVVDDGSRDRTAEVARSLGAHVIRFAGNRGLVNAFIAARDYALEQGADIICNLDADGQHDPRDIARLVEPLLKNKADIAIGSRFIGTIKKKSFVKMWGNRIFSAIISLITSQNITDSQSGFRAYTREVAKKVRIRQGFTYTQQMLLEANSHRFKICEVPITEHIREHGRSRLMRGPIHFAARALNLLMLIVITTFPLRFFAALSFLFIVAGILIGLAETRKFVATIIIILGFMFLFFGILFELINKSRD